MASVAYPVDEHSVKALSLPSALHEWVITVDHCKRLGIMYA